MFAAKKILSLTATLALVAALASVGLATSTPAQAQDAASGASAPAAAAPDTAAPAAAPAPIADATTTKETVDNPYGPGALWAQGDFVAKLVLVLLVLMSLGSWYILITKLYESIKLAGEAKAVRQGFFKSASLDDAVKTLKDGSAFRFIAESGMQAGEHHEGALTDNIDLNTWVTMGVQRSVDDVRNRLQDGLGFLATVGSTAPFVGLFGTVWGIMHALTAIGIAGQASIDKVAGPVGEALIMTAFGLAVAVPAVLGYNWLVSRNKSAMESVRGFGADLHGILMGAKLGARR
ncbi:MAG TPA: MotA/TolQ/ExbB proton channel family protein [Burkholderiaceae bacterium]|jgi:biopolymer transport protein ExbB